VYSGEVDLYMSREDIPISHRGGLAARIRFNYKLKKLLKITRLMKIKCSKIKMLKKINVVKCKMQNAKCNFLPKNLILLKNKIYVVLVSVSLIRINKCMIYLLS